MKKTTQLINEIISAAKRQGIIHLVSEDPSCDGRIITVEGQQLINFGSYSYLGLETDTRLKEAGIDAIRRYGLQSPSTRAYISNPLYLELEELVRQMFGASIVLSTCLTTGHDGVLPVIVEEGDALILDQQVHASVQRPARALQLEGVTLTVIRHNKMDELKKN
jgi:7-keto-8-aminopelargonate synthetase-like enzyme